MSNIKANLLTEFIIPDINGDRCVHAHIETASCKACVTTCPENAWILDDESLALNTELCDGCGLCVSACTEGAILQKQNYTIREEKLTDKHKQKVLLLACEKTNLKEANCQCLHSFSYTNLLHLKHDGIHQIHVTSADCKMCSRGKGEKLVQRVTQINKMLRHNHLFLIHYNELPSKLWQQLWKMPEKSAPGPDMTRRMFFRTAIKQTVDTIIHHACFDNRSDFVPLGEILPSSDITEIVYPAVPYINQLKCIGCDACVRACPHNALQLQSENGQEYYTIKAKSCTACQICEDICEENAIHVQQWSQQTESTITLITKKCNSCGANFHYLEQRSDNNGLCTICSQINHQKNLFQVMN